MFASLSRSSRHLDRIADLNCDEKVDGEDLAILLAAWGPCEGFQCDPGDPPSTETITSTGEGNFVPLYAWLVNSGQTELALQLATNPGLVE